MDISMATPRPPGVRCADVNEEQFVLAHNSLPKLAVYSYGGSGFASLACAHSAQPNCPRQRTRINPCRGLALSARATS